MMTMKVGCILCKLAFIPIDENFKEMKAIKHGNFGLTGKPMESIRESNRIINKFPTNQVPTAFKKKGRIYIYSLLIN